MDGLAGAFENLTAPQAEIISSAVTLVSALTVALVAPLTFHLLTRRGVRGFHEAVTDLKEAASRAREQSNTIGHTMGTIAQVSARVNELGILLASVQETLANTQNTLLEQRASGAAQLNGDGQPDSARERVRTLWRALRERVEQAASNPHIHGGTRARYARMDRRSYWVLVEALLNEGNLTGDREQWREAYRLGAAARNQADVTDAEARTMAQLEAALRDVVPAGEGEASSTHPTLSPGVLITPRSPATSSAREQLRAGLDKASGARGGEQGEQPSA